MGGSQLLMNILNTLLILLILSPGFDNEAISHRRDCGAIFQFNAMMTLRFFTLTAESHSIFYAILTL